MQSTDAMHSTTGLNMQIAYITITREDQIRDILFGANVYEFDHNGLTFEKFKKFVDDEVVLFNWDMYPIRYINRNESGEFLDYLEETGAHEIVYVARIDTSKISEDSFDACYKTAEHCRKLKGN